MTDVLPIESVKAEVGRISRRYNADSAFLFGSYARGEAAPQSDIDVLIEGGPNFRPSDVFSIAEELFRSLGKNVDVYEMGEINPGTHFYDEVMRDRVAVA